ncbi:hypothetical protein Sdia_53650 [Streptomyces diastaticus subsp. diastaticus]|uniref:Uncharacterized protein n=1 Tax=Streptomyces diastaticus subsp. diastaticus TaxID=68040 RepID=A0ABQ1CWB6_STRDI|nr:MULTISPECIES: hypothetical protein [Streptomyces]MBL3804426.1 hypothetical protein [Streptomyces sp. BRB081]GFH74597.1 hypothetical protein Sdia_53650 [Streptomyces diastaticus subsp. diastaticus]GGU04151.1 hypothetical protein GCM10015534_02340 [Streptomyces diastaticus subsp. diastaticus]
MNVKKSLTTTLGVTSALLLAAAPAHANWTSSIGSAGTGFESRRWADKSYSQIWFKGCTRQGGSENSVDVGMWRDVSLQPDHFYGSKHFTACFSSSTSNSMGEWNGLADGSYYFKLESVGGGKNGLLWVNTVTVDTTLADS